MPDRFRTYDVLAKRDTLSWNPKTRAVIDQRLALEVPQGVLEPGALATLRRLVERVCPDPPGRPPTTTLAMIVHRIAADEGDGFRHHALPATAECWRRGLAAVEAEAQARCGKSFADLAGDEADGVLRCIEAGDVRAADWDALPPKLFWQWRLMSDLVTAHWSQPSLWSAMGFGGPASPRGYVRLAADRRDPWEAIEEGVDTKGLPRHAG